jgi:hypothetical protein
MCWTSLPREYFVDFDLTHTSSLVRNPDSGTHMEDSKSVAFAYRNLKPTISWAVWPNVPRVASLFYPGVS